MCVLKCDASEFTLLVSECPRGSEDTLSFIGRIVSSPKMRALLVPKHEVEEEPVDEADGENSMECFLFCA